MKKMQNNMNESIANIDIYRLDIYRLLTMLLADKPIIQDKEFITLGNEFTDGEVNRLLILVAAISRQLLAGGYGDKTTAEKQKAIQELAEKECGQYWEVANDKKILNFRMACNSIIHASDIRLYKLPDKEQKKYDVRYFEKYITILYENKKQKTTTTAEFDFLSFIKICIMLSTA